MKGKAGVGLWLCGLLLLAGSVSLGSCLISQGGLRHISGPEFLKRAEHQHHFPMSSTLLIGATQSAAYLEHGNPSLSSGWKETVYWTELDNLPADIAARLRAGKNPWSGDRVESSPPSDQPSRPRPLR